MTMEIAGSQNAGVRGRSKGMAKTKGLQVRTDEKQKKQTLSEDPFEATPGFGGQRNDSDLFDDFDDPFEDQRDQTTTTTPIDQPERAPRNSSPKGVDDASFDPFKEIGNPRSSFYTTGASMDPSKLADELNWQSDGTITERTRRILAN